MTSSCCLLDRSPSRDIASDRQGRGDDFPIELTYAEFVLPEQFCAQNQHVHMSFQILLWVYRITDWKIKNVTILPSMRLYSAQRLITFVTFTTVLWRNYHHSFESLLSFKKSLGNVNLGIHTKRWSLFSFSFFIIVVFSFQVTSNFLCITFIRMSLLTMWHASGATRPLPRWF